MLIIGLLRLWGRGSVLALPAAVLAFSVPAQAAPGPPILSNPSFTEVTETSAFLHASVDPSGTKVTDLHFDYIPLSDYEASGESFAAALSTAPQEVPATVKVQGDVSAASGKGNLSAATGKGDLADGSATVSNLTTATGAFALGQEISGDGIPQGTTITALDATSLTLSKPATKDQPATDLSAGSKNDHQPPNHQRRLRPRPVDLRRRHPL